MTQTNFSFNRWLTPPTFADEEQNRLAGLQHTILWSTIAIALIFGLLTLMFQPEPWPRLLLTALLLPAALGSLLILYRGEVKKAGLFYAAAAWLILTIDAWLGGGLMSAGFSSYTIIIVVIGILAGLRAALLFAGLSVVMGGMLLYAGNNGLLPVTPLVVTPVTLWLALTANFVFAATLVYLATDSISNALKRTRANEAALLTNNRELQSAQLTLQERTGELTTAVELLEIQLTERQQILESLARSQQELRQLNLELEQRIRERTSALVKMNETLTQEVAIRRQAELALQETVSLIERAKREWEVTVDSAPQFIGLLDRQGRLKRANRTVERWRLAPVTDVREKTLHQLFHPDCTDPACPVENFWRQASQKLEQGQAWYDETDDEILGHYLQWQINPIAAVPSERQQPSDTWGVVVVQDVSEHKQAEQRLRESEAKFRSYIEHAPLAVFVSDGTGRYVEANQVALDMLGYDAPALYDKHIPDIVPEEDHPVLFGAETALRSVGHYEGELRQQRLDGQQIWISLRAVKISDDRLMAFCQDITARKQAEQALRESEQRFRDIIQNAQAGYFFVDAAGYYRQVNKAWLEMHGYSSAEEVIGQHFSLTQVEVDLEEARHLGETILAGQPIPAAEFSRRCQDGSIKYHSFSSTPVIRQGQIVGLEGFMTDLTERRRIEQALEESEARYRTISELTSDYAYSVRFEPDGTPIGEWYSDAYKRVSGLDTDSPHLQIEQRIYPADRPIFERRVATLLSGSPAIDEYRIITVTGELRWLRDYARPEWDEGQGRVVRVVGAGQDITARKQAEESLRESEAQYRLLAENMVDVVWTMNPVGQFTYVSPSVERLRGYTAAEVLAQPPAEALTPASLQVMEAVVKATMPYIEQGAQQYTLEPAAHELEQPRQDGSTVWTEAVVKVLFDDHGKFSGFLGVSRDISERKRTELELARYRHHLEELVSERTAQLEQANQKLQRSEAQFRQVITSISDHIYVTEITATGEHFNQYISPNVELLTGYAADGLLADWSFWSEQVVYPADWAVAAAQLAQFEQGRSSEAEYRLIRADGQVIWVRDSGRVEPRNGTMVVYGVINDITARKADEEIILLYSERLEILREIEQGILSAQSVKAIVQATMSRIQRLIPCHSATVTIIDLAANEALTIASGTGFGDEPQQERRTKFSQAGARGARLNKLRQGEIVIMEESQLELYHQVIKNKSIRSVLIVPLIYQEELIGSLNLSSIEPGGAGTFSSEHQEVARQVAGQLAIAIRQTQLYEQVQRHAEELEQRVTDRTRELSALYEVTAVASQALELPAMLAQALGQVLTALRSGVGFIWLWEREAAQQFQLAAQQGLAADEVRQVEASLTGSGLLSQVLEQNQPLVLPTLATVPHLAGTSFPAGLETLVGASIRVAGQQLGVVTIFGRLEKQFNLEDVALLSTVADQMGVAVENTRLREQARQAAVLAERERLARELHDSVTQSLYSLTLFAEGALEQARNGQLEPVQHNLTRIGEAAQQALKEMRLMVYELRPIDLEQEGLVGALHQRLAAVERRAGITARLIAEDLVELPLMVEQELFGITQEALNNILKHSGASLVTVHLRRVGAEVELAIQDNGYGFDPGEVQNKGGLGLRGLRERVDKLHGVLTIRSAPDQGTTIEVRVRV